MLPRHAASGHVGSVVRDRTATFIAFSQDPYAGKVFSVATAVAHQAAASLAAQGFQVPPWQQKPAKRPARGEELADYSHGSPEPAMNKRLGRILLP